MLLLAPSKCFHQIAIIIYIASALKHDVHILKKTLYLSPEEHLEIIYPPTLYGLYYEEEIDN